MQIKDFFEIWAEIIKYHYLALFINLQIILNNALCYCLFNKGIDNDPFILLWLTNSIKLKIKHHYILKCFVLYI